MDAVVDTELESLSLIHRGKVRDIYDVDDDHMLIVTTDRISAFDVILPNGIPGKGKILTQVSSFWFAYFGDLIPNQLSAITLDDLNLSTSERAILEGRSIVVKKLNALPFEAIVRGYLIGSGWNEYQKTQSVCGIKLPAGILQAGKLPEILFTPSTKAAVGKHDENISFEELGKIIDPEIANQARTISIEMYRRAAHYAEQRGIIIADTKFEFGLDQQGTLTLIDEALTPDSSRFWPADTYTEGASPESFDKQYIRDYLETLDWDKKAPGPTLPDEVVLNTQSKYQEAADRLLS